MLLTLEDRPMAKTKASPKMPDKKALLLLKGTEEEKATLDAASKETGVSLAEMTRRGLAMWILSRGLTPPADWVGK